MTDTTPTGDFIFGTLATTQDRIESAIQARRGLSAPVLDMRDGAARMTLTAGPEALVTGVRLYFTTDGSDPVTGQPGTMQQDFEQRDPAWDTVLWSYVRRFETTLAASHFHAASVLRYRAMGYTHGGKTIPAAGAARFSEPLVHYPIPEWWRDAIVYHIFVDRFSTDSGRPFATHNNLAGFYGGTLRGITERLDYLSDLGVNALWLSPIYPSPSHHGYDATDFLDVEPRLGTKADFQALVDSAHKRGIRIILDFVPNHVSNQHPFFKAASTQADSPYRDYFTFTKWPKEYRTFFGVKHLPQINNDNPDARRYVIDSALYWMKEFGVDGFRLDYANGPNHDFWADYYLAVKTANPNSIHFGEIVETPELLRSYAGRMDGALDFHFLQNVRKTFVFDSMTVGEFDDWLDRHERYFSGQNFTLPSFLDNHDMNRFLWVVHGDTRRLKLAALLQFMLPAPPIIYYGTESGLNQMRDVRQAKGGIPEESRVLMNWDTPDSDMVAFYKRLIALRREVIGDVLDGTRTTLIADDATGQWAFGYRVNGSLSVIVLINHAENSATYDLEVPGQWRDAFSGENYGDGSRLFVQLPAEGATLLQPLVRA